MKTAIFTLILQLFYQVNAEPRGAGAGFLIGSAALFGAGSPDNVPPPTEPTVTVYHPPETPPGPPPDPFAKTEQEPTLTIYYDAMEENSQKFFKTNFTTILQSYSPHMNIVLIPCQQAYRGDDGKHLVVVQCGNKADHHCKVNRMHVCAIDLIKDKTQLANYLICTMASPQALPDFHTCATQNNVNDEDLRKCSKTGEAKLKCINYSAYNKVGQDKFPAFVFKNMDECGYLKENTLENLDYFRNSICENDFNSAACAKLKACKAHTLPKECNQQKLILAIFYKTMEEKSQKWFHSLASIYDTFSNYFTFKFQPCIQAEGGDNGSLNCHDENDKDCVLGKTHACAVSHINDAKALFHFLSCTMQDTKKLPDLQKCATDNKIQYDTIKTCASGDEGKNLCINCSKGRPCYDHVPLFSFELAFDEALSNKTTDATNLQSIFCDQLKKYGFAYPTQCK